MATESESLKPIWTTRDKIIVAVCALGWLFIVLRYYPGDIGRSMYETGLKMFWSSGLAAIFTRLLVRFLAWIEKTKSSWPRIIKIFLALAIAFGIMLAIEDYKKYHLRPATEVSRPQILSLPNHLSCQMIREKGQ